MFLQNSNSIETGGYNVSNSLRFQSASSNWMNRTPAGVGTSNKIMTFSAWVKRGAFATLNGLFTGSGGTIDGIQFWNNNIDVFFNNGATRITTSAVYRDPSAWYHIVVTVDTTQASAADRVRIYVNGSQVTATTGTAPAQNYSFSWNQNVQQRFGTDGGSNFFDGYTAEVNVIDGQALTPSSFGETNALTGQWVAKKYTGTYGTNGFYLPFSNGTSTTTLGADSSGNSNNWTLNNFTRSAGVSDCWMNDVPSGNGSAVGGTQPNSNYAVLNPLSNAVAPVNANLRMSASTGNYSGLASMTMPSGKWYWECVNTGGSVFPMFGIARASLAANVGFWTSSLGYAYYYDGTKYNASTPTSYGASYTANDIIGVAFDADAGTLTFYKNNVSQGVAFTGLTQGDYCPAIGQGSGVLVTNNVNFGQRSFAYTPPSGFKALCTANLPASTIVKGNQYMDATTYTGNGTTNRAVVNSGAMQPDFVWVKDRSNIANHILVDAVRGVTSVLYSNTTLAQQTGTAIASLNSNGFSVNEPNTGADSSNINGRSYVGWQWNAGGSTVTNTNGSISSQVRANPTAGVSVVTWTGSGAVATVGHGLGIAPKMMIVKSRGNVDAWRIYHESLGNTRFINFDTSAAGTASTVWNNTTPSSSVFTLGTESSVNGSGRLQVAYCFSEIAGFSRFGSYTGNGSADGTFVYFGFRPKFVMVKRTDSAESWITVDTVRDVSNPEQAWLYPNLSNAEATGTQLGDAVSNGFKFRSTTSGGNISGATYIYMAFAENPFAQANAR